MKSILSWLRQVVADFFSADPDAARRTTQVAEEELATEKTVAALAVAHAGRAALALQEALDSGEGDPERLGILTAQLEDARERARSQVAIYRELQQRVANDLERLNEAQRLAEINEERERLRRLAALTQPGVDSEALNALEAEAKAEAAKLDVLDALDSGATDLYTGSHAGDGRQADNPAVRARELLADSSLDDLWPRQ